MLKAIGGGKSAFVDALSADTNIDFSYLESTPLRMGIDRLKQDDITALLAQRKPREDIHTIVNAYLIHPQVVVYAQMTHTEPFVHKGQRYARRMNLDGEAYLPRIMPMMLFPTIQDWEVFGGMLTHRFVQTDRGQHTLVAGLPQYKIPTLDERVQHNRELSYIADALFNVGHSDISVEHIARAEEAVRKPFAVWARCVPTVKELFWETDKDMAEIAYHGFTDVVQTLCSFAKDYLLFHNGYLGTGHSIDDARTFIVYGWDIPQHTFAHKEDLWRYLGWKG